MTQTVLSRVAEGEAGAEEALLDRYGGLVWSLARRVCSNRAEAEDAVQEIMLDVWRTARQGRFDPSKASDTTFVAMIARRRLIDRMRRKKISVEAPPDDIAAELEPPAARSDASEDVKAAAAALTELSPPQQTTIRLAIMHGLTHEQIAETTGMPLGTVKTHIRRGLIRLRDIIQASQAAGRGAPA